MSEAHGELQVVPTKTYERRSVSIPANFVDELAGHLRRHEPSNSVWSNSQGSLFRHSNWYPRHYKPAVERANPRKAPDSTTSATAPSPSPATRTATSSPASKNASTTRSIASTPTRSRRQYPAVSPQNLEPTQIDPRIAATSHQQNNRQCPTPSIWSRNFLLDERRYAEGRPTSAAFSDRFLPDRHADLYDFAMTRRLYTCLVVVAGKLQDGWRPQARRAEDLDHQYMLALPLRRHRQPRHDRKRPNADRFAPPRGMVRTPLR